MAIYGRREVFGDPEERRKEPLKRDGREEIQALIDATTERVIRNRLADEVLESPLLLCKLGLFCRENVAAFLRRERW